MLTLYEIQDSLFPSVGNGLDIELDAVKDANSFVFKIMKS